MVDEAIVLRDGRRDVRKSESEATVAERLLY